MQEDCVPVDHLPDSFTIRPEVLQPDISSETRDVIPERVTKEDNRSVSSLKRKDDDIITEEDIKEQEGLRSEPQLTKSVNESQSTSVESSKPVRRHCRLKPQPNLTQTSRRSSTSTTAVIPPTLDEGRSFRQSSSHLWQRLSHILMDGQSASESREVSHLLITDALVPVSEDEEKKSGYVGDVEMWVNLGMEN